MTTTTLPVVRANLTGTWDLALVGTPAGAVLPVITLGMSESAAGVTGVLAFSGDTEAPGLTGSISGTRELVLNGALIALRAAVDEAGRSFSGTYVVTESADRSTATFNVRGTKRSDAPSTLTANETRVPGQSRADQVPFSLPAGSSAAIRVGPVLAAVGRTDVSLEFDGSYIILACVGSATACTVTGGRPTTTTFVIPGLYAPGAIQASVYFNPNFPQPAGDGRGLVRFSYNPQWR